MSRLHIGGFRQLETALVDEVRAAKASDPFAAVTVVLGSDAQRRYLSRLLATALGAHANVRFVTIHHLALELAVAAGGDAVQVLSSAARLRLVTAAVRRTVADAPDWYYAPVAAMPGLPRAFARTLKDLREACLPAEAWPQPAQPQAAAKLAALVAVYRRYVTAMRSSGALDDAELYRMAAIGLRAGSSRLDGAIIVYGLYDLPQTQRTFITALAAGGRLTGLVPGAGDGSGYTEPACRFFASLGLRRSPTSAAATPAALQVLCTADDEAEADEVVRQVYGAVAAGGGFHDTAVVAPGAERADCLAVALEAAGVPVARAVPLHAGSVRRLQCLLECVAPSAGMPLARAAVIDYAASLVGARAGLDAALVARWNAASRDAAVVGGEQWPARLQARRRRLEYRLLDLQAAHADAEEPPDAQAERGRAHAQLEAVLSLERFVARLSGVAGALPAAGPWSGMVAAVLRAAAAEDCVQAHDAVSEVIERLNRLDAVEERVERSEFLAVVRDELAALREPRGAIGRTGVAVLTPYELRGLSFDTVVFTGLSEGGFPTRLRQDPLLLDDDRRLLGEHFGAPLEEAGRREAEWRLLFDLARHGAGRRFIATFARLETGTGRSRLPSRAALEMLEAQAQRPVAMEDLARAGFLPGVYRRVPAGPPPSPLREAGGTISEPLDARDFDLAVLLAVAGSSGGEEARFRRAYLQGVCGAGPAARLLGRRRAAAQRGVTAWDAMLSSRECRERIVELRLFHGAVSPTGLREYVRCPFRFYVRYLLELTPPEEPEDVRQMEAGELGSLAHRVLRRVFASVAAGTPRDRVSGLVRSVLAEESAAAEASGLTGLPFLWQSQRARLADDLRYAVLSDPCWAAGAKAQPWRFEAAFGGGGEVPVGIELDGGAISFRGRIDRVDLSPAADAAVVIDYKTGSGRTESRQLRQRRDVQLPVYLLAAEAIVQQETGVTPRVACQFRLVTRRGGFGALPLAGERDAILADLRLTVGQVRRFVEAGVFPRSVAADHDCHYCDLQPYCDDSAWTRERKREAPELDGVVRLQLPLADTEDGDDAAAE